MPDRIQRNRTTGEYRIVADDGSVRPYTPTESAAEMYHPGVADTPTKAFFSELGRTGKEAAIGLARSPWDLLKNTFGLVAHPINAISGTAHAIAHPLETAQVLGDNPREAGSAIGQLLLGQYGIPALAPKVPGALTSVGGGLERAGTALAESKVGGLGIPGLGAAEAIFQGDPKGVAVAAAPYAMKYGGRGIRKLGEGLEGLKTAATEPPDVIRREIPYRAPTSKPYTYESSTPAPTADLSAYPEYTPALPRELPEPSPEPATMDWLNSLPETPAFTFEGEAGIHPPGPGLELYNRSSPEVRIPEIVAPGEGTTLPVSWQSFTENPVTQGLRTVLEELRQRATPGLTNPTGR